MKVVALMVVFVLAIVGFTQAEPMGPAATTSSSVSAPAASTEISASSLEIGAPADLAVPAACYSRYTCLGGGQIFSTFPSCIAAACGQCVLYERCCNGVCQQP
jgi:hypothetical protein